MLRTVLFLACSAFALSATAQAPQYKHAEGVAVDRKSGELLYRERHSCDPTSNLCSVEYVDGNGDIFARKLLNYSQGSVAPFIDMKNFREGTTVTSPDYADGVVADAGFDNYVRESWEALSAGDVVEFSFQPLGLSRPLTMVAVELSERDCLTDELCVRVKPKAWLWSALTKPIDVIYSRDSRLLRRFSGTSNIKTTSGGKMQVDINYSYAQGRQTLARSSLVPLAGEDQ